MSIKETKGMKTSWQSAWNWNYEPALVERHHSRNSLGPSQLLGWPSPLEWIRSWPRVRWHEDGFLIILFSLLLLYVSMAHCLLKVSPGISILLSFSAFKAPLNLYLLKKTNLTLLAYMDLWKPWLLTCQFQVVWQIIV